jgi:hypothetical protein
LHLQLTVYTVGAGALLTSAVQPATSIARAVAYVKRRHAHTLFGPAGLQVCLFDWPFFNKNPINFEASKKGMLTVKKE